MYLINLKMRKGLLLVYTVLPDVKGWVDWEGPGKAKEKYTDNYTNGSSIKLGPNQLFPTSAFIPSPQSF